MYRLAERPLIKRKQTIINRFFTCSNTYLDILYDGGSDWYILNREFVHYATYGDDELVNGLQHMFNYSLLPCEVS